MPPNVAPLVPVPPVMANVTLVVALVTVLPNTSRTATFTTGAIAAPATAALGCTVMARLAGTPVSPVRAALHVVVVLPQPE
jgi:hypothetical protein